MKIKVPITALDADLNDREMLLVNLITHLLCFDNRNVDKLLADTEFYIHLTDIRKITKKYNSDLQGSQFDKLRKVLVFKETVNDKIAISLRNPVFNKRSQYAGLIKLADYELMDQTAINLYYYLVGVVSVRGVVKQFKKLKDIPKEVGITHSRVVHVPIN